MTALDSAVILYGGRAAGSPRSDLWAWHGYGWGQVSVSADPPPRAYHAMTPREGRILLFGGLGQDNLLLGDTWEGDGERWTELTPAEAPPPRSGHAMVTLDGKVLLFGGAGRFWPAKGDTWEWDGERWTELTPASSPSPRTGHKMARLRDKIVLFGGCDGSSHFTDTWEWDGESWQQRHPDTSPPPLEGSWCPNYSMASLDDKILLYYGDGSTWEWDGQQWTCLHLEGPAPSIARSSVVLAAQGEQILLFGAARAAASDPALNTWLWDGASWSQLLDEGRPPGHVESKGAPLAHEPGDR